MDNNTTNYVDQYLEKQRQKTRKKKVVFLISLCVILLLIVTRIVYKKYRTYNDEKRYYTNQVINLNQTILMDYDVFLRDAQNICVALLFHNDSQHAEHKKDLSYPLNSKIIDLLRMMPYNQNYRIDITDFQYFMKDSSSCLRDLMFQETLTQQQKKYVASIYTTYSNLSELYSKLLREELYPLEGTKRQQAEYQLFYEGAFLFNYVNHAYSIIDNVKSYTDTEKSIARDKRSESYSDDQLDLFKNAMSRSDADDYAKDFSKVIFGEPKDLFEIENSTETYDPLTRSGSIYQDGSGKYLTDLTYSSDDFNENESIIIDLVHQGAYYRNNFLEPSTHLSNEELDSIAQSIINRLGYSSIKLKNRYEPSYYNDVFSYTYIIADDDYEDEVNGIYLTLYKDGHVESFSLNNKEVLYGTYKKKEATLSLDDAKKTLSDESRNAITSWVLTVDYDNKLYYKFTITSHNQDFYIYVDAASGELNRITD